MIIQYLCILPILICSFYSKDITLGYPDTITILINPTKVIEKNDTILVLDQEGKFEIIKEYTLDGFFVRARLYNPRADTSTFTNGSQKVDSRYSKLADSLIMTNLDTKTKYGLMAGKAGRWHEMILEGDSLVWLTGSWQAGDGGGLTFICIDVRDSTLYAVGTGPYYNEYKIYSIRSRIMRPQKPTFYFYVGLGYVYLISSEFLFQYDRKLRFVRKVGIEANQCFKEPCGIALGNRGLVYITDFRLGTIWEYRPGGKSLNLKPMIVSEEISPETPTFLSFSKTSGLWVTDVEDRVVKNVDYSSVIRSFTADKISVQPGGTNYRIAVADSMVYIYYQSKAYGYTLIGQYQKTYERRDYEGKKDDIICMDNVGNFYMFKRGTNWGDVTFYRIDPIVNDTSIISLPDSIQPHRMIWSNVYRCGDTLYMLGESHIYRPEGVSSHFRGFFVFVNDTLSTTISESEFEDGLPLKITDFTVDSYGLIWVVDIENRVVQRYRLIPD